MALCLSLALSELSDGAAALLMQRFRAFAEATCSDEKRS